MSRGVQLQTESVRQARQVIEDADNVRDFETGLIVESQVPERAPVLFDHTRRRGAEFFSDGTERAVARGQAGNLAPAFLFDRFDQRWIAMFGTQKLRVRLRSIMAILRRRRDPGDHLALLAAEAAFGGPHNLAKQLQEGFADPPVRA